MQNLEKLFDAIDDDDPALIARMVQEDATLVAQKNKNMWTALGAAVWQDKHAIVEILLKAHADPNRKTNREGETPLMLVCTTGNLKIAELLITHGADVNARDFSGSNRIAESSIQRPAGYCYLACAAWGLS